MPSFQGAKTQCPQGHPYDEENTRLYTRPKTGQTQRFCIKCVKLRARRHQLQQYNTTPEEVDQLFKAQNGKCAICDKNRARDVDHDHETGRIRGLLCNQHNQGLGLFGDNPELLRAAADYLERTSVPARDNTDA